MSTKTQCECPSCVVFQTNIIPVPIPVLSIISSRSQRDPLSHRFASLTMVVGGRGRPGTKIIAPLVSSARYQCAFLITTHLLLKWQDEDSQMNHRVDRIYNQHLLGVDLRYLRITSRCYPAGMLHNVPPTRLGNSLHLRARRSITYVSACAGAERLHANAATLPCMA